MKRDPNNICPSGSPLDGIMGRGCCRWCLSTHSTLRRPTTPTSSRSSPSCSSATHTCVAQCAVACTITATSELPLRHRIASAAAHHHARFPSSTTMLGSSSHRRHRRMKRTRRRRKTTRKKQTVWVKKIKIKRSIQ